MAPAVETKHEQASLQRAGDACIALRMSKNSSWFRERKIPETTRTNTVEYNENSNFQCFLPELTTTTLPQQHTLEIQVNQVHNMKAVSDTKMKGCRQDSNLRLGSERDAYAAELQLLPGLTITPPRQQSLVTCNETQPK